MSEWQPIETAPRNGECVLVYDPSFVSRPVLEARMMEQGGLYCDPTYYEWFSTTEATHWQPLPEPPK